MLENKDYCDYETCVALKELGFNEYCRGYFDPLYKIFNETSYLKGWNNTEGSDCGVLSCPSLYEAQKWLREEKGIFVYIDVPWKTDSGLGWSYFCCNKPITEEDKEVCFASGGFYDSYEEALFEGIKSAVKFLTIKNE